MARGGLENGPSPPLPPRGNVTVFLFSFFSGFGRTFVTPPVLCLCLPLHFILGYLDQFLGQFLSAPHVQLFPLL